LSAPYCWFRPSASHGLALEFVEQETI
jgi:hypothetical protein